MIRGSFLSEAERRELTAPAKRPSGKAGPARRAHAIVLLDRGSSFEAVADVMLMDDEAVRDWHRKRVDGGTNRLLHFGWRGSASVLSADQMDVPSRVLSEQVLTTTAEIIASVEHRFGIVCSRSGMIKLLGRLGFVHKKPKALPQGASVAAQERFAAAYETSMNGRGPDGRCCSSMRLVRSIRAVRPTVG